jgi:fibronectin-binding autotransporter adhesin
VGNAINGTGGNLKQIGTGTTILTGTNTYTGTTTISAGTLQVGNGGTTGTLGTGNVVNTAALSFNRSDSLTVSNLISGTGGTVSQIGTGTTTLTGNNTYTGATNVNAGTLLINGNQSAATGAVTVTGSGTTLGGTGTIGGAVTVNAGANIAPGNGGNTTAILSTGALTLAPTSNFRVDLNGTTVGSQYDQLNVTGSVTLTGSNLVVTVGFSPITVGEKFTIINNDGTDAVIGMFAQGSTVTGSNGDKFTINYRGGDGNDVVLTVAAVPEPSTWMSGALALAFVGYTLRRRFARLLKREA